MVSSYTHNLHFLSALSLALDDLVHVLSCESIGTLTYLHLRQCDFMTKLWPRQCFNDIYLFPCDSSPRNHSTHYLHSYIMYVLIHAHVSCLRWIICLMETDIEWHQSPSRYSNHLAIQNTNINRLTTSWPVVHMPLRRFWNTIVQRNRLWKALEVWFSMFTHYVSSLWFMETEICHVIKSEWHDLTSMETIMKKTST